MLESATSGREKDMVSLGSLMFLPSSVPKEGPGLGVPVSIPNGREWTRSRPEKHMVSLVSLAWPRGVLCFFYFSKKVPPRLLGSPISGVWPAKTHGVLPGAVGDHAKKVTATLGGQ